MKKIPTLFIRDPDNPSRVLDEYHPECLWVPDGEGEATFKWNGSACRITDDEVFEKRRVVKPGQTAPPDFELAENDEVTGKSFGWVFVDESDSADKWFMEALNNTAPAPEPGTYEAVGPHFQGNPHGFETDRLVPHGQKAASAPRTFDGLAEHFAELTTGYVEGYVWWHPDGRKAKIKAADF